MIMPARMAKRLYNQNIRKHRDAIDQCRGCLYAPVCNDKTELIELGQIKCTLTTVERYTIVELEHAGKHYQGLATCSAGDKYKWETGIAIAYNHAFKKMMGIYNGEYKDFER